jgi:antitoxin component YwqK of YwqJK toxin-antitoxin module
MWYSNGQLMKLDTCVNGRVVGLSRTWHSNGVLESSYCCIDGRQEGKVVHFYPTGQVSSVAYKKNYKNYNLYQTYYDTSKEYYSFDNLLPEHKLLDPTNSVCKKIQVSMEMVYDENGELLIRREYYRNGKISQEEIILDEPNFRLITFYHENGNLSSISYIKNGKSHGHYQQYDGNGLPIHGWDYDDKGRVIKKD